MVAPVLKNCCLCCTAALPPMTVIVAVFRSMGAASGAGNRWTRDTSPKTKDYLKKYGQLMVEEGLLAK